MEAKLKAIIAALEALDVRLAHLDGDAFDADDMNLCENIGSARNNICDAIDILRHAD